MLPSFYKPETEELKWSCHYNVRKMLFMDVFRNLKYCEFKRLKNDEATFELGQISADPSDPNCKEHLFDRLIETYWSDEKRRGKLVEISKWTVTRKSGADTYKGIYRVKVYHMDDDEFRAKLYP